MWLVFNADNEFGFWGVRGQCRCWLRWRLELLLNASPAATKSAVGKVRAGWVEAEEFVEDNLVLSIGKRRLHKFDAVYMWQSGDVVEERWRGPAADFLMDLESCSASEFPGIEHKGGGDGSVTFEGLGEEGDGQG